MDRQGIVAILNTAAQIVGTGFVVSDSLIVTCAHVIEDHVRVAPDALVSIRFYATRSVAAAYVVTEYWRAPADEDVAFLRLSEPLPDGVSPMLLGTSGGTQGHPIASYGYTRIGDYGEFPVAGTIIDRFSPAGAPHPDPNELEQPLAQATVIAFDSPHVGRGMSGAPLFDKQTRRVIGMIAGFPAWKPDSRQYLAGSQYGRHRDVNFAVTSDSLRAICHELSLQDICPYKGLEYFTEEDAEFFFGREAQTNDLLDKLAGSPNFLAVIGVSGSGKSSLIRAGLLPKLKAGYGGHLYHFLIMRPGPDPYQGLAEAGMPVREDIPLVEQVADYLKAFPTDQQLLLVVDQLEELFTLNDDTTQTRFLAELQAIINTGALPVTLVLSLRADYYGGLLTDAWRPWLEIGQVNIQSSMSREQLADIVRQPAIAVGLRLDQELIETLVEDALSIETPLPLVETALRRLWELRDDGLLTLSAYRKIRGVVGAVSEWAERGYLQFDPDGRDLARNILGRLIHYGQDTRNDTRRPRTVAQLQADSGGNPRVPAIIKALADRRLLVTGQGEAEAEVSVEIVHDALLTVWERLRQLRQEDREFKAWRQRLEDDLAVWERDGRGDKNLLFEGQLITAEAYLKARRIELAVDEIAYIEASVAQRSRRRQRTLMTVAAVIAVLLTLVFCAIGLSVFGYYQFTSARSSDATAVSENQQRLLAETEAERRAIIARAEELANLSLAAAADFPQQSMLLAVEAARTTFDLNGTVTESAEIALRAALTKSIGVPLQRHEEAVTALAASPDGRWLLSAGRDGEFRIWTLDQPDSDMDYQKFFFDEPIAAIAISPNGRWALLGTFYRSAYLLDLEAPDPFTSSWILFSNTCPGAGQGITCPIHHFDFAPDSQTLAIYNEGGAQYLPADNSWNAAPLQIYDLTQSEPELVAEYATGFVDAMRFSPDGSRLAVAIKENDDAWLMSMDTAFASDSTLLETEIIAADQIVTMAFSQSGRWLFAGTEKGQGRLWDLEHDMTLASPVALTAPNNSAFQAALFTPSEDQLLAAGRNGFLHAWPLNQDGTVGGARRLEGHRLAVSALIMDVTGQRIISASMDHSLQIWNMADFDEAPTLLTGHDAGVTATAFASERGLLFTGDEQGALRLWQMRLPANQPVPELIDAGSQPITLLVKSSGENWFAAATAAGQITLYRADQSERAHVLTASTVPVTALAFSPNEEWLVAADEDGNLFLWEVAAAATSGTSLILSGHTQRVNDLAISSDNRWLVTGGGDDIVRIWDLESPDISASLINLEGHDPLGEIIALAISSDDKLIATGSWDKTIRLWDLQRNGQLIDVLPLTAEGLSVLGLTDLAFSPDGRWLVAAPGASQPYIWNTSDFANSFRLSGHGGRVTQVLFDPTGTWLVTVEGAAGDLQGDGTILLWDMRTADTGFSAQTLNHDGPIESLSFSSTGDRLIVTARESGLFLWTLADGPAQATPIYRHTARLTGSILLERSDSVIVGSQDGMLLRIPFDTTALMALACQSVGRNFSFDEWAQFFPGESYRQTCQDWPIHQTLLYQRIAVTFGQTLLDDDFSDGESGLTQYETNAMGVKGYGTEDYRMDISPAAGPMIEAYPQLELPATVRIDVACGYQYGSNNGYGLVYRYQDPENYYAFMISGTGQYRILRRVQGVVEELASWTPVPVIAVAPQKFNSLTIVQSDDVHVFYLNGNLIASLREATFSGGSIGLISENFESTEATQVVCTRIRVTVP